jgi:hypothetical protein
MRSTPRPSRLYAEPWCSIGIDALKRANILPFLHPRLAFAPIWVDFSSKLMMSVRYYRKLSSWPFGSLRGQWPARRDGPAAGATVR